MNLSREVTHISLDSRPSAWFGVAISIYPIFEVLFSMFRRKTLKKHFTKPDKTHLHSLLFRLSKNNPKTTIFLLLFNIPFMIICVIFNQNTSVLILICIAFIFTYLFLYKKLVVSLKCR